MWTTTLQPGPAERSWPVAKLGQHFMRVLLIDHNWHSDSPVMTALDSHGYETVRCRTADAALAGLNAADLILLNLELPGVNGLRFMTELRLLSSVPVLAYSIRDDSNSIVAALQCGADDYMVEPVRPRELLARMRAISRRAGIGPPEKIVWVGDIKIRLRARVVEIEGEHVHLTPREFEIVAILASNAGTAVGREDIMREVWGRVSLAISRTLDVHMTAIRGKLARPNLLLTVRGFGYRLGSKSSE